MPVIFQIVDQTLKTEYRLFNAIQMGKNGLVDLAVNCQQGSRGFFSAGTTGKGRKDFQSDKVQDDERPKGREQQSVARQRKIDNDWAVDTFA